MRNNYFEASPREIVLGELGAGAFFAANSPIVRDNYFTTRTATPFNVELENTVGALIEGNSEAMQTVNTSNCFINAATSGESQTYIGHNTYFQNAGGYTGNALCINGTAAQGLVGTGSFTIANTNYLYYAAYVGFSTAAATSESVAIQHMTSGGRCHVYPLNGTAQTSWNAGTSYISAYGAGGVTFTHPNTAGIQLTSIA